MFKIRFVIFFFYGKFDSFEKKFDYMPDNPCRGKWNLAKDITEYVHSSARFYLCEEQDAYPVTNYFELDDIDLTKLVPD